jgi:hypothetical protein
MQLVVNNLKLKYISKEGIVFIFRINVHNLDMKILDLSSG